jgi:hypothetical protein
MSKSDIARALSFSMKNRGEIEQAFSVIFKGLFVESALIQFLFGMFYIGSCQETIGSYCEVQEELSELSMLEDSAEVLHMRSMLTQRQEMLAGLLLDWRYGYSDQSNMPLFCGSQPLAKEILNRALQSLDLYESCRFTSQFMTLLMNRLTELQFHMTQRSASFEFELDERHSTQMDFHLIDGTTIRLNDPKTFVFFAKNQRFHCRLCKKHHYAQNIFGYNPAVCNTMCLANYRHWMWSESNMGFVKHLDVFAQIDPIGFSDTFRNYSSPEIFQKFVDRASKLTKRLIRRDEKKKDF